MNLFPRLPGQIELFDCNVVERRGGSSNVAWRGLVLAFGVSDALEHLRDRASAVHQISESRQQFEASPASLSHLASEAVGITQQALFLASARAASGESSEAIDALRRRLECASDDIVAHAERSFVAALLLSGHALPTPRMRLPEMPEGNLLYTVAGPGRGNAEPVLVIAASAEEAVRLVRATKTHSIARLWSNPATAALGARIEDPLEFVVRNSGLTMRNLLLGLMARHDGTAGFEAATALKALVQAEQWGVSVLTAAKMTWAVRNGFGEIGNPDETPRRWTYEGLLTSLRLWRREFFPAYRVGR